MGSSSVTMGVMSPVKRPARTPKLDAVGSEAVDAARGGLLDLVPAADVGEHLGVLSEEGKVRSEEHTSELQSRQYILCRLRLENTRPLPSCAGRESRLRRPP